MLTIQVERLEQSLMDEMQPLWDLHWEEVGLYRDRFPLSVDREWYQIVQDNGLYVLVVARDNGTLVGYVGFTLMPHPHYQKNIFSNMDVAYLLPEYRSGFTAIKLFKYAEAELKQLGVDVIMLRTKDQYNLGGLFKFLGYTKAEEAYSKYIGD